MSYGAKRRVRIGVKVTKKTVTYSDRQVAQKKLGTSKEKATKARMVPRNPLKSGKKVREWKNLSKPQLFKILRKYRDKEVFLTFTGGKDMGAEYKGRDISSEQTFSAATRIDAQELFDYFDEYVEEQGITGKPKFGLTVYDV